LVAVVYIGLADGWMDGRWEELGKDGASRGRMWLMGTFYDVTL